MARITLSKNFVVLLSFKALLLFAPVTVAEIGIVKYEDMNALLGEPFTMTCPEGGDPFRWFKGNNTQSQIAVAIPAARVSKCAGEFAERKCSISITNGDLTLDTITLEDEGPYVCRKNFRDGGEYKLRQMNVNVNPTGVIMNELKHPIVGQPFQIECTVDRVRPGNAKIYFKFTDQVDKYEGKTEVEDLNDGTFRLKSILWKEFERSDNERRFRCVVEPPDGRGKKGKMDRKIYVYWQYQTEVIEHDETERPLEGESKTLKCVNTPENEGKPKSDGRSDVRWVHNGIPVQNDRRHDGASTRKLTINELDPSSDNGKYVCLILNAAGTGKNINEFQLTVWSVYRSSVRINDSEEVPLVGAEKSLLCYPEQNGYPSAVRGVRWFKGTQTIGEGDKYQIIGTYTLVIKNLDKSDNGAEYSCRMLNDAGEGLPVKTHILNVYWAPKGKPEIEVSNEVVGIESDVTLRCSPDQMDAGNPTVSYTIWTKSNDIPFNKNITGTSLQLSEFESVLDGGEYYCSAGNIIGQSSQSPPAIITVETPVHIEAFSPVGLETVTYDDVTFTIKCAASGSNIDRVTWYKDKSPLDEQYFDIRALEEVQGTFKFDQKTAAKSVVGRNIGGNEFDCDNVQYYSGSYRCEPHGMMAGEATSDLSETLTIDTVYPALWAGRDRLASASRDDESKTIKCDVCAKPPVKSFSWQFKGADLRSGIQQNGDSITIDRVGSNDFGVYTCQAQSDVNSVSVTRTFDIELTERGKPYEPKEFEVVRQTSISASVRWKAGFAAGYEPQTFRLEYKLTGATDYTVYKEGIAESEGWIRQIIIPLAPSSEYDVRVRATNQRPKMPNYSEYVTQVLQTKARPEVKLEKLQVEESRIQVTWSYDPVEQRRKRAAAGDDGYSVGLQIQYKKNSEEEFSIYPEDGSKLPAEERSAVINGTFDVYAPYTVKLMTYENDLSVESASSGEVRSEALPKPKEAGSMAGIIGGVLGVLVIIIIVVIIFIVYKKRQQNNKSKGGGTFELSGKRTNQRNSTGYTPLPNNQPANEESPYLSISGLQQVNGDRPYMNMDDVNQSTDDGLYDSIENPGVRRCPAGPPPTDPPPEPLYAKPNKGDKKKKNKKKDAPNGATKENPYANAAALNGTVTENPYQNVNYSQGGEPQESLYDDVALNAGSKEELTSNKGNAEDIVYADLDIEPGARGKNQKKKKPVVIQSEPATEYAVIDFGKKAPPVDDEEC